MIFALYRFIDTRFISFEEFNNAGLPMYPNDFELYVKQRCLKQREFLEKKWIPTCAQAILELKENWKSYVPHSDDESLDLPMKFFAAISSEMSNQLREMVYDSLAEFVKFIEQYGVPRYLPPF
jgi:hypothetical protein